MPWPLGRPRGGPTTPKLTEAQVVEIRLRYRTRGDTQTAIARDYGVSCDCIYKIVNNLSWRWLPGTWSDDLLKYSAKEGRTP